jgi:hypothetical protein
MNVSTDACILINLLRAHRLDLLGAVPPYVFCVPTEALGEITYPDQQAELKEALDHGWIQETRMEAIEELQIFARANEQLRAVNERVPPHASSSKRTRGGKRIQLFTSIYR